MCLFFIPGLQKDSDESPGIPKRIKLEEGVVKDKKSDFNGTPPSVDEINTLYTLLVNQWYPRYNLTYFHNALWNYIITWFISTKWSVNAKKSIKDYQDSYFQ